MSEIRKAFTSRFAGGRILEIDFSQLEIFALAYLANDKQLKADLLSGKDLHGISATALFGAGYTDKQRKIAKQLSFQLQYGAGAKSMAETNGITIKVAKQFIENYYERYTGVQKYHERLIKLVAENRTPSPERTPKGKPAGTAILSSQTGRRYKFTEQDAPDFMSNPKWGKAVDVSFSPTQIKNYPVQGFATGDIVPLVLGKLYRFLKNSSFTLDVLMINTVHDSVVFDCSNETTAHMWYVEAKRIMEEAPKYLRELFPECADFDLPLKVEGEIGEDWYEMEVITK